MKSCATRPGVLSSAPTFRCLSIGAALALFAVSASADEVVLTNRAAKFLGATTCSSSSCHGGGGAHQNQYLVWSLRDFHSQRPFATLTTARSKQIADALEIKDPTTDHRCTSCHSPLQDVPALLRGEEFRVSEGVSCESCHGPAENWFRSHTRPDWTQADRAFAGMRDLNNLYVRANTCVACHQTVEIPLLKAGHPELIFELDGQSVSQPKHWREKTNWNGAQSWLVGQAAALREMSWQLTREREPDEKLIARWRALLWLLQKLEAVDARFGGLKAYAAEPTGQNLAAVQKASDELALRAAGPDWTGEMSRKAFKQFAATAGDFRQQNVTTQVQARRAERLVLALDRLFLSCDGIRSSGSVSARINRLFELSQSLPDFKPAEFAAALEQLNQSLDTNAAP